MSPLFKDEEGAGVVTTFAVVATAVVFACNAGVVVVDIGKLDNGKLDDE